MRPYLLVGIALVFVSCSHRQPATQQRQEAHVVVPSSGKEGEKGVNTLPNSLGELDNYLQQFERPTQHFSVGRDSNTVVRGAGGTRLFIVPDDLEGIDGSKVGASIAVSLIELQNQQDLLRNRVPTTSNGNPLESGGSYYINLTSAGKQLRLKKGRQLAAEFPKKSGKEMKLFYGSKDQTGSVTWDPAKETFRPKTRPDSMTVRVPIVKYKDTILAEMEVRPDHKAKTIDAEKYKQYGPTAVKLIDGRLCYIAKVPDLANPAYVVRRVASTNNSMADVYEVIQLYRLGWINCDRFAGSKMIAVEVQESPGNIHKNMQAFLVFKDVNSLIKKDLDFSTASSMMIDQIPENKRATLIAFSWKNGIPYACAKALSTQAGSKIKLDLKPVSKAQIVDMMNI